MQVKMESKTQDEIIPKVADSNLSHVQSYNELPEL